MQARGIRVPGAQHSGVTSGVRMGCRDAANGPRARAGAPSSPDISPDVGCAVPCAPYLTAYFTHSTEISEEPRREVNDTDFSALVMGVLAEPS